ncbi:alpha-amylase family glycosyl hydrolase [Pontibacter sp. G13]|uniref:alpha-amylase family glycosyl hydrolase n=1 Tax=Pontibacter sp. G13 TaxID=3074898 RepID=UPI00288A9277|nr:alpha-amylase family glycosyl hydrolase [Pontibacter sp. G13]WNJ18539.1 alpha-amylase family glycosyl hydrolase [Pontibacter sp. G13]
MNQERLPLQLIQDDPWLAPYAEDVQARLDRYHQIRQQIEGASGSLIQFAQAYQYFGLNYDPKAKGWWFREWAPGAKALHLIGDFNGWNREANPLTRVDGGIWELFLPEKEYGEKLKHESLFKIQILSDRGIHDRLPAYVTRVLQDPETHDFSAQVWRPEPYVWNHKTFKPETQELLIYEAHTGMAQEREGLGTYREFADLILPRIKDLGYNAVQLMAVQEHPYYGSFGYHVSNFFAPSSRFGTPEDLKYLIDQAHGMGIAMIMDIVHSHAVKNEAEGLNFLDGTDYQYFHGGGKGDHSSWDSKLFDYGKWEVRQFLLSNVAYWIDEFRFDGFRFDGVTSMLYDHHGHFVEFDHYDKYFRDGVAEDAINYLQLANDLAHELNPHFVSIAEDMSGMPGCCRTVPDGGLGFDYRLGMGIPDYWIKLLKHTRDEEWNLHEIWHTLTNRRWKEKTIAYAESHDQALVGDKTLAFWLMDKEMYWHMEVFDNSPIIDRGISLHKMIRLVTAVLGGDAYLTFMGNEFGHPEWVDFPREGNNWSYQYARRQWSLADRKELKYKYLLDFDRAMIHLLKDEDVLQALPARQVNMDETNQVMICERNNLYFVFNFSIDRSIPDYKFPVTESGAYRCILNSDASDLGGHGRIDDDTEHHTLFDDDGNAFLSVYSVSRSVQVYQRQ